MTTTPRILVGLPYSADGELLEAAMGLGAPVLISAGSLYREDRGGFQRVGLAAWKAGASLDSAGFTAMRQGGYRWTVDEYVAFVVDSQAAVRDEDRADDLDGVFPWKWWSAMDYCCEPEIAADRGEVERRIVATIETFGLTLDVLDEHRAEGVTWVPDPMPILQGRTAADYALCAELLADELTARGRDGLPCLVGLGSVCRRNLHGPDGLLAILAELDRVLPPHVRLHLFGVKGAILEHIAPFLDRIASIDSMAWDFRARRDAQDRRRSGEAVVFDTAHRAAHMAIWLNAQHARLRAIAEERAKLAA